MCFLSSGSLLWVWAKRGVGHGLGFGTCGRGDVDLETMRTLGQCGLWDVWDRGVVSSETFGLGGAQKELVSSS